MLINLLLGLVTMTACLVLQSLLLLLGLHYYHAHHRQVIGGSFVSKLIVLKGMMVILVAGNIAQIAIWACLFLLLGEFSQFNHAFYHSAVNFATLGYGDIVMSEAHRLLGPLEAVNGVLMIGFSTAVLMAVVSDLHRKSKHRPDI